jgi:hypothetical protein
LNFLWQLHTLRRHASRLPPPGDGARRGFSRESSAGTHIPDSSPRSVRTGTVPRSPPNGLLRVLDSLAARAIRDGSHWRRAGGLSDHADPHSFSATHRANNLYWGVMPRRASAGRRRAASPGPVCSR